MLGFRHPLLMKLDRSSFFALGVSRAFLTLLFSFPTVLLAHPGHYHPDETDEFDFFQATFFHSHGVFDLLLLAVFFINTVVLFMHAQPKIRLCALLLALCSLGLIPIV